MRTKRTKSALEINEQCNRLMKEITRLSWDGKDWNTHYNGWCYLVQTTAQVYIDRIFAHFGASRKVRNYTDDRLEFIKTQKVPVSVYASE